MIAAAVCFTTAFVRALIASVFCAGFIPLNVAAPIIQFTNAFDALGRTTASASTLHFAAITFRLFRAKALRHAVRVGDGCAILSPGASTAIVFLVADTLFTRVIHASGAGVC